MNAQNQKLFILLFAFLLLWLPESTSNSGNERTPTTPIATLVRRRTQTLEQTFLSPVVDDDDLETCKVQNQTNDDSSSSNCARDRFCVAVGDADYFCLHKTLWPLHWRSDVVAWLATAVGCFIAATAGIGGGGLVLPCVVLFLNFTPKEATVISNSAVVGNALAQFVLNYHRTNKDEQAIVMVAGTVLVLLPGLLAGGEAMLALSRVIPSTLILILASITLILAALKTFRKALQQYKSSAQVILTPSNQTYSQPEQNGDFAVVQQQEQSQGSVDTERVRVSKSDEDNHSDCTAHQVDHAATVLVPEDQEPLSWWLTHKNEVYGLVLLVWSVNAMAGKMSMLLPPCSAVYFLLVFLPMMLCPLYNWQIRRILQSSPILVPKEDETKHPLRNGARERLPIIPATAITGCNDAIHEGLLTNHQETSSHEPPTKGGKAFQLLAWWIPAVSIGIGALSALLGIGGGELIGPLLLVLNMDPRYSSTTTATLSLINAATNFLNYLISGRILTTPWYNASFLMAGILGGGSGRAMAIYFLNTNDGSSSSKTSIIAFSLCLVLSIGAVLIVEELVTSVPSWTLGNLCP